MIRFSHAWRCSPHYHCIFLSLMVRIIPAGLNKFKSFLLNACLRQCCGCVTWSGCGSGSSDPYLWLTDPDADPGGPKTYGSRWGSGSGTLIIYHWKDLALFYEVFYVVVEACLRKYLLFKTTESPFHGFFYFAFVGLIEEIFAFENKKTLFRKVFHFFVCL